MKVLICIPTYNEAANIQAITKIVDQGLQLLASKYTIGSACIVNCDSASTDNTVDLFEATQTISSKRSLRQATKGKGTNLLRFIEFAGEEGADACITIDADIISANPEWIVDLLTPIVEDRADYVTPLYERSRFEGSSTIHFAYPTIRAFTGQSIRQPIGGDFAFGRRMIERARHTSAPSPAHFYGIDIFLTYLAAVHSLRIEQVQLGKKIHTPSFGKLEEMFPQVAETAAHVVRRTDRILETATDRVPSVGITSISTPTSPDKVNQMYERAKLQLADISDANWLPQAAADVVAQVLGGQDQAFLSRDAWVQTLAAWYSEVLVRPEVSFPKLTQELLPLFVLRAMGFWKDAESWAATAVESEIDTQAELFRDQMLTTSASALSRSKN